VLKLQSIAEAQDGRLLRVLFLRLGRLSTDPRAARLLSLTMQPMTAARVQNTSAL
jgi:hypothetical protein